MAITKQEQYETEHEKRMTLYKLGMTDAQMAAALQVPIPTIVSWRRRERLAPNRAAKSGSGSVPAVDHPWRDKRQGRQDPKRPAGAPTVDAITKATATCDALTALSASQATDFPIMFAREISTGRILVDRRPWWLRRDASNA